MKYILLVVVIALIVMQFFTIDKSVPEFNVSSDFVALESPPEAVSSLLTQACYDCHSYKTEYPWYAHAAPVSWWLVDHIKEGREHLNLSAWAEYPLKRKKHKLKEMIEEVEEREMPLKSYTWIHADADLSDEERAALVNWLKEARSNL